MNAECVVPEWLHDTFLGYGDPSAANYSRYCRGPVTFSLSVCKLCTYVHRFVYSSLVPRPRPPGEGKGLVTIARFLVCAESAVLFSRQPIRLLGLKISCDIKCP